MLVHRVLLGSGLGLALLGGVVSAVQTSGPVSAHRATVAHVVHLEAMKAATNLQLLAAEPTTAETDATAPCATDASGSETGDCKDSSSTAGPAEPADTAAEATTPDTDTVQSGDQSSPD